MLFKKSFFMKKWLVASLVGALVIMGCQPKPSAGDLLKNLVVTTNYDNTVDFSSYNTYYLRLDSINYYNSSDPYPSDTLWKTTPYANDFVDYVTMTVSDSLTARGYRAVSKKTSPDLKVYIYEIENYSVSYSYYPYNYGYGYGYGGGYLTASASDQSDLYIQILDLKHLTKGKPTLIWYCDIGDIASLTSDDALIRALARAFKQSSYLKK
jgi:hypothetical protein